MSEEIEISSLLEEIKKLREENQKLKKQLTRKIASSKKLPADDLSTTPLTMMELPAVELFDSVLDDFVPEEIEDVSEEGFGLDSLDASRLPTVTIDAGEPVFAPVLEETDASSKETFSPATKKITSLDTKLENEEFLETTPEETFSPATKKVTALDTGVEYEAPSFLEESQRDVKKSESENTLLGVAPASPYSETKSESKQVLTTHAGHPQIHTPPASARYLLGEELGRGAVGRVRVAQDPILGREVALKMLIPKVEQQEEARARFLAEARVTAGLGHPNIVPVFDVGRVREGTFYFTMQRVRGRSLASAIYESDGLTPRFGRYRLIGIVHQVCQAVAFAHTRGVLHRDLKPQNVMVGDFGEVYLMDWGLAKMGKDAEAASWWSEGRLLADVYGTQEGQVRGTPAYMAPEQAQGLKESIDERTDIFGLGAILYEVLTQKAPIEATEVNAALLEAARGNFQAPSTRAPEYNIPPELEEICLKAMARNPRDRYGAALDMARDLELYLEGAKTRERKCTEAYSLMEKADEAMKKIPALEMEVAEVTQRLNELRRSTQTYDPVEKKRYLWKEEKQLAKLKLLLDSSLWDAIDFFHQAFALDPSLGDKGQLLASFSFKRYLAAKEKGQESEMRFFETFTRRFAPNRSSHWFEGEVEAKISTSPSGAEVFYAPYIERDHYLQRGKERRLGVAPVSAKLPWGSGVLLIRVLGYGEVIYPLYVRAEQALDIHINIYSPEEIGTGFLHVPKGEFFFGGDPDAGGVDAREKRYLQDFFVAKRHITCGEYAAFLNTVALRNAAQAAQHAPRLRAGETPFWLPGIDGRYTLPCQDFEGTVWQEDWPVCWISLADAESYASFRSVRDQTQYRLLREEEWEKAARGTDGRLYPWGNYFDPIFCHMNQSISEYPSPVAVGSYPIDRSPYGVWDFGGNVGDLTTSYYSAQNIRRVTRGGAYPWGAQLCRASWRGGVDPHKSHGPWGFRLVKDPPR